MDTDALTIPDFTISRDTLRPGEATRNAHLTQQDAGDRPRASSEDSRLNRVNLDRPILLEDSPPRDEKRRDSQPTNWKDLLTSEETIELFRTKVENAKQDTEYMQAGTEHVIEMVKPKLTLDLGHSNIGRLPDGVVDIIKAEVERLSLSKNQIWHIPARFSTCTNLRYLNIRSNTFRDIPRGIFRLMSLEILDMSKNKLKKIPKEVQQMTSLKVLSVQNNRIEDLPTEICEMNKLKILKVADNPLRSRLKKVLELKVLEVSDLAMNQNEKEAAITTEIKQYLREQVQTYTVTGPGPVAISEPEGPTNTKDMPLETPRPVRRTTNSRFPVIPNTNSIDGIESQRSSPNSGKPPIPARSHYRVASGLSGLSGLRRPGVNPIITGSERNRSNSESVLQASAQLKMKKMGAFRKERSDLDSIDETKANRNSHLRGVSHASALKRNGSLVSPGGGASASTPTSPREARRQRGTFVKRLSSLPECKIDNDWDSPIMHGAKGILYALYQIHPTISGLITAVKGKDVKRSSLEFTFYNASTHVDRLNEALEQADTVDPEDEEAIEKAEYTIQRDCATCIMVYTHVAAQLQQDVHKIVAGTDARYVRSLMLLLFGSINEIRIAVSNFGVEVQSPLKRHRKQVSSGSTHQIETIPEEYSTPQQLGRIGTPLHDRAQMMRPGGRLRSDTTIQHPVYENGVPPNFNQSVLPPQKQMPTQMNLIGTTLNGSAYHSNNTSMSGSTMHSANPLGHRSRSNSRNANNSSAIHSTISSVAGTPRSEAFNIPPSSFREPFNQATGMTDSQEEALFDQLFNAFTRAYEIALQAIPLVRQHFVRCMDAAEENQQPKELRDLWAHLNYRCKSCLDVSEALQIRLQNLNLRDSSPGNGRNDPSFWLLWKGFIQTFVELITDMREAKDLSLLPREVRDVLKPLQRASKEASRLVEASPWVYYMQGATSMPAPTPFSSGSSAPPALTNGVNYLYQNGTNGHQPVQYPHPQHLHNNSSPFPPPLVPVPPIPHGPSSATSLPTPSLHSNMNSLSSNPPVLNTSLSPVSVPLPATPLSAALGPAAQATMPTNQSHASNPLALHTSAPNGPQSTSLVGPYSAVTPASSYSADGFSKVFQRADSLLSMPQAPGPINFLNRRA